MQGRNLARDLAVSIQEARKIANTVIHEAPVDVLALAKALSVSDIQSRSMGADGYIRRLADGNLAIRYREGNTDERNRFTIAHELGHIILAKVQGQEIGKKERQVKCNVAEERAVDRIAAELILPEAILTKLLLARAEMAEYPWDTINALRHYFRVSTTSLVLRILELPKLHGLIIRVQVGGNLAKCAASEGQDLRFLEPVPNVISRIAKEKTTTMFHPITVRLGEEDFEIRLHGHERPLRGPIGLRREYWCVGWRSTID